MMHSSSEQVWQSLVFLGFGTICGAVAAWRSVRHRTSKPSLFRRFWSDVLFVLGATVLLFLTSLATTAGQLRMIYLVFSAAGYVVSHAVCFPFFGTVHSLSEAVCRRLGRLLHPFYATATRFLSFFCKKIRFFCKKGLRYKHVMMYNCDE